MWLFGDRTVLFTGGVAVSRNHRFSLGVDEDVGSTLIVDPVEKEDQGRFTCKIMVEEEINLSHVVHVVDAFAVKPVRSDVKCVEML